MKAPCYQCGKPAILDGLCAACYNQTHPLIEIGTPLTLTICKHCGAIQVPGGWKTIQDNDTRFEEPLFQQLDILLDQELKIYGESVEISIEKRKELDRVVHIVVHATGQSHPSLPAYQSSIDVEVRLIYATCETCSMMSSGYHELILQIRAEDRAVTETEEQEILSIITARTQAEYGKDSKAFVSSIDRNRFGLDILIGSEHLGKLIADELESVFLASRKENYKLIGQERGDKKKYRITIVLRLPRFTIGDFVEVAEKPCQVISMSRNRLKCYDLSEKCDFTISPKSTKWRTLRFLAPRSEVCSKMIVSIDHNGIVQLMDSETYKLAEVGLKNLGTNIQQGETIKVINLDGTFYAVPKVESVQ